MGFLLLVLTGFQIGSAVLPRELTGHYWLSHRPSVKWAGVREGGKIRELDPQAPRHLLHLSNRGARHKWLNSYIFLLILRIP